MEDNKKIFIRGSKEHGDKVIKYLENVGNKVYGSGWYGKSDTTIYFLDNRNNIHCLDQEDEMAEIIMDCYKEVTIDEVLAYFAGKDRWDYDGEHTVKGYRIVPGSGSAMVNLIAASDTKDTFATQKHAKSALAMAQISQYMTNDPRYGGIITDEEWDIPYIKKYVVYRNGSNYRTGDSGRYYEFLAFHAPEQRKLFLREHEDLVKEYLMID